MINIHVKRSMLLCTVYTLRHTDQNCFRLMGFKERKLLHSTRSEVTKRCKARSEDLKSFLTTTCKVFLYSAVFSFAASSLVM